MPFVAGYFIPLPEEHRIVMSGTGRREFTFYVIFHEYTHLLVDQNVRRLPLWLHEGLAEFYSTFSGSERSAWTASSIKLILIFYRIQRLRACR